MGVCVCLCSGLAASLCPLHLSGLAHMRWLCGRSRRRQHSFDRMIQGLKLFHMTLLTWLLCLATLYLTVCVWGFHRHNEGFVMTGARPRYTPKHLCVFICLRSPTAEKKILTQGHNEAFWVYRLSHLDRDITFSSRLTWWKAICCDFSFFFGIFSICCKWQHILKYVIQRWINKHRISPWFTILIEYWCIWFVLIFNKKSQNVQVYKVHWWHCIESKISNHVIFVVHLKNKLS